MPLDSITSAKNKKGTQYSCRFSSNQLLQNLSGEICKKYGVLDPPPEVLNLTRLSTDEVTMSAHSPGSWGQEPVCVTSPWMLAPLHSWAP